MKTRPLGNTEYDMITSEVFIPGGSDKNVMVVGNGYFDNGSFDKDAMAKAYREIFRRNDALRMRIVGRSFFRRQYIQEYFEPTIAFHTLQGGREAFAALCRTENTPHITLSDRELCLADIYSCSDGTGGIILWQHHIVSDGYTMLDLLYKQLCEFYVAYKNGEEPKPPKRLYSHDEYIDKRIAQLKKHGVRDFFGYLTDSWKYLFRYSVPVKNNFAIKPQVKHRFVLTGEEYEAMQTLCRDLNCSVPCLVGALTSMIVSRRTGKNIFKIDMMSNGRNTFALKNTAGDLTTSIPMFMNMKPSQTAEKCIKNSYMEFLKNAARVPFPTIVIYSTIECLLSLCSLKWPWENRWIQLNYYKFWENHDAPLESFLIEERLDFMSLYVEFSDVEEGLSVFFQHAAMIMDEQSGKETIALFRRLVTEIAKNPNRSLEEIYKLVD